MLLGYNTNGMVHHDLLEAVELLAEIGYRSVAVTIDHHALPPGGPYLARQIRGLRALLRRRGMRSVIETGAPFLLDPARKHEPTLVSPDLEGRRRRIDFYRHAVRCAAELGSDCVSLWSGVLRDKVCHADAVNRLVEGLAEVLDHARQHGVVIALEPEPGMVVAQSHHYEEVSHLLDAPDLRLTLDVGHLQCHGELPIAHAIRRWAPHFVNVHLEDMRRGVHEHLMFGEGEIDFPPVLRALAEVGYTGGVHVELSRHSHEAPEAARRAFAFLRSILQTH